jgi:mono/diheme cytochrome c family protein
MRRLSSALMIGCVLAACSARDPKLQQYVVRGEELYVKHCSNCHQKSGAGLGLVYPPVAGSDFVDSHWQEVICLMRYGRQGELVVNGKTYNQAMPANPLLTDLEIAEIATYLYNHWGRNRGLLEVNEITPILNACAGDTARHAGG